MYGETPIPLAAGRSDDEDSTVGESDLRSRCCLARSRHPSSLRTRRRPCSGHTARPTRPLRRRRPRSPGPSHRAAGSPSAGTASGPSIPSVRPPRADAAAPASVAGKRRTMTRQRSQVPPVRRARFATQARAQATPECPGRAGQAPGPVMIACSPRRWPAPRAESKAVCANPAGACCGPSRSSQVATSRSNGSVVVMLIALPRPVSGLRLRWWRAWPASRDAIASRPCRTARRGCRRSRRVTGRRSGGARRPSGGRDSGR